VVREGAIDGLSIGYRTVRGRIDPATRVRRLYQVASGKSRSSPFRCSTAPACAR